MSRTFYNGLVVLELTNSHYVVKTCHIAPPAVKLISSSSILKMFDCSAPLKYKKCKTCHELACEKLLKMHTQLKCQNTVALLTTKQCPSCDFLTYSDLFLLVHTNSKEKHCHLYWEFRKNLDLRDVTLTVKSPVDSCQWFKCGICERFRSEQETELVNHIERTHEGYTLELVKWWACDLCTYKHKHRYIVLSHVNVKHAVGHDIKWFNCEHCDYKTKSFACLHAHNTNKHTNPVPRNVTWHQCALCSHRTKVAANLRLHVEKKHTTGRDLKTCTICGAQLKDLKGHMRYNHGPIVRFKCTECSFSTRKKEGFDDHVNVFHTDSDRMKWYYCDKCPFKANRRTSLGSHFRNNHKGRTEVLSCDKCDYKTNFKKWLVRHIAYNHTPDEQIKWFKCESCDYKSKSSRNLTLHVNRRHLKKPTM